MSIAHADGHHIPTDLVLSELNQLSTVPFIPLLSTPFFVPFLGKLLAQVGQARYPTWASTLPHLGTFPFPLVPKISPFSSHQYLPLSDSSLLFSNHPFPFPSPHHSPSSSVLAGGYKTNTLHSMRTFQLRQFITYKTDDTQNKWYHRFSI